MKKLLFLLVFMGLAVAVFYSCKKDGQNSPASNNESNLETMSPADILIRNRILDFRENVGNHLKSEETVLLDSALWNIESTINYTYCWNNFDYIPLSDDSLSYTIPLTEDGKVLQSVVDSIYLTIISDLTEIYDTIDADVKHMIFSKIVPVNTTRDGLQSTIIVRSGFGINPLFVYGSFDEGEDWIYGNHDGMCNDASINSDAAEEIEFLLNNPENPPIYSGRVYFTDPKIRTINPWEWPNPNDDTPGDNLYDFLVFYEEHNSHTPNYHECLSYEEMNFYLSGTAKVINSYWPNGLRYEGYTFWSVDLSGTQLTSQDNEWIILHSADMTLKYGIQHITNDPPIDL